MRTTLIEGAAVLSLRCPEHKCRRLAAEPLVRSLLSPDELRRYDDFKRRSFADSNVRVRASLLHSLNV